MSTSSLKEMKEWAVFMDRGIREVENFLRQMDPHLIYNKASAAQVMSDLEQIINDMKNSKLQLKNDMSTCIKNSEELKTLLEVAVAEKNKLRVSLNGMSVVLGQGELQSEDSSESSSVNDLTASVDSLSLASGPSSFVSQGSSPCPASSTMEESYVVVEVTPGLNSRIPKSRLVEQNEFLATPLEEKPTKRRFGFLGRRNTLNLIYSPSVETKDASNVSSQLSEMDTPVEETAIDPSSNCIMERPKMPILSSYVYELLGVKYNDSIHQMPTPTS